MVIVVNEEKLSKVLSEFARTLITEFPIQGILDHLVERIALDLSRDTPGDLDRLGKPSAHPLASLVVVPAAS